MFPETANRLTNPGELTTWMTDKTQSLGGKLIDEGDMDVDNTGSPTTKQEPEVHTADTQNPTVVNNSSLGGQTAGVEGPTVENDSGSGGQAINVQEPTVQGVCDRGDDQRAWRRGTKESDEGVRPT